MPTRTTLLVDPAWLEARLQDPSVRVIECTTHLHPQPVGPSRIVSGLPEFERERIPGARYVNMATDMSDPQGRYPYTLLSEAQAEARLAGLDVGDDHEVVLYSRGGMMSSTRVWYVLHALGHRRVSILDGGYERWRAEGREVSEGPVDPAAGREAEGTEARGASDGARFRARRDARRIADLEAVRAALDDPATVLVNALSREQFLGTGGAHYGRPGSIPGSVSVPARELISPETGRFLDRAALQARFAEAGVLDAERAIVYCGGGVAATVVAFALEMLEHPGWSVYDNSLLEWSAIPEMPMVRAGEG